MVRGILSGSVYGVIISAVMLVVVSQQTDRRSLTPPTPVAVQTAEEPPAEPTPSVPAAPAPVVAAKPPSTALPEAPGPVPRAPDVAMLPEAAPVAPTGDTPVEAPDTVADLPTGGTPDAPPTPTPSIVVGDAPMTPPAAPAEENAPPAPRDTSAPELADAPVRPLGPGPVIPPISSGNALAPDGPVAAAAPRAPAIDTTLPQTAARPEAPGTIASDAPLTPRPGVPQATLSLAVPDGLMALAPDVEDGAARPSGETSVAIAAPPAAPTTIGAPGPLPQPDSAPNRSADTVITNRLPRIGDTIPPDPIAPNTEAAPSPETAADAVAPDALTRNSTAFENDEGLPIVAVVLLAGDGPPISLPFPVSVALDVAGPQTAAQLTAYRDAGVEVLLIPDLPAGAQPTDVARAMQDSFATLPGAVAVMDTPEGLLQSDRDVLGQVVAELTETGHGFITFPRGLNTAVQVAERSGVETGLVFRDIDGQGQDLRAVKRFLDQAAFRARQENAVILVARNRPETIAALAEWALGNRAASVALAPVSAALTAQIN